MDAFGFIPSPRTAARSFRDLLVWQKAHEFVLGLEFGESRCEDVDCPTT